MNDSLREKTEQVLTPLKADLIWFVILLLAVVAAIYGAKASYHVGYKHGVQDEKIGWLEDRELMKESE